MLDARWVFMATGLLTGASLRGFWVVFATWVAINLGLTPLQLILLGTAMEVAILVSEIPTGVVADVISRRLSVIISMLLMGSSIVIAGSFEAYPVLIGSQMLWGLGWTFMSGAETAWITDELGGHEAVEQLILKRARLQAAFSIVGMAAGAGLAALTTLPTAIISAGAVMIGWGLVLIVAMPEHEFTRVRGDTWQRFGKTLRQGAQRTRRVPALRVLVGVAFLAAFGGEVLDRLDIRRLDQIGLPSDVDEIVVIGVIASLEAVVAYLFVRRLESGVGLTRIPIAATALLIMAAGFAALLGLVAALPIAALGLVGQGGLRSAMRPITAAWANAHTPPETRATVHSFVGQFDAGGEILGGLILAWVATATTVPTAMSVSVALFAGAGILASNGRRVWGET